MKKIILLSLIAFVGLTGVVTEVKAQTPKETFAVLQQKAEEGEKRPAFRTKEERLLDRLDTRIKKAKAEGKSTEHLEKRREVIAKRIQAKKAEEQKKEKNTKK